MIVNNSSSSSTQDATAKAELVTLVLWLQTFPGFSLVDSGGAGGPRNKKSPVVTSDNVMDLLSTSSVAREIWKVAEDIYGEQQEALSSQKADDIWTGLLVLTSTRARPLQSNDNIDDNNKTNLASSPPRLKAFVLSSLLDSAVQAGSSEQRRTYIQRILTLPKETQKDLMSLIERRGTVKSSNSSSSSSKTPTPTKSAMKKTPRTASSTSRNNSNSPSTTSTSPAPGSSSSRMAHSTAKIYGSSSSGSSSRTTTTPPPPPPPPPPPLPSSSKDTAARHRHSSNAIDNSPAVNHTPKPPKSSTSSSSAYATPPRRPASSNSNITSTDRSSSRRIDSTSTPTTNISASGGGTGSGSVQFLSPATMESPNKLQNLVHDLRLRNDQLQTVLDQYQDRHEQLQNKMGSMEIKHRQDLLHQETLALERLQSAQDEYHHRTSQLQAQLEAAQQEAADNAAAAQELSSVRDQLEELQHQSQLLNETMEKLRRYKSKVEELHDVQQQYLREQEAHASCVQEICRLETQVASLEPFKRQVEDYKTRAIDAEVKLAEATDYLQRLEQTNKEQSLTNDYLWRGAIVQKEQLEELHQRIQQEVSTSSDKLVASTAERINPELQAELARLRAENVQLRRFVEQRQEDAVSTLQQELENAQRLGDVYKNQYLTTKATLAQVQAELAQTQQCLQTTTEELTARAEAAEANCASLQSQLQQRVKEIELAREQLQHAHDRIHKLEEQVREYQTKLLETDKLATERLEFWKQAQKEVDDTNAELDTVTKQCQRLLQELEDQKVRNKELEDLQNRLGKGLQSAQEELEDAHMQIAEQDRCIKDTESSVMRLTEAKATLQEQLEQEQQAHQESRDEAHQSLQATRTVLLSQHKKQVDEIQDNMNRLLEDERRANRRKDDDHKREISDLNHKWKQDYDELKERLTMNLQQSRQDAVERIESLKKEYQLALDKSQSEYAEMKERFNRDLRRVELEAHERIEKAKQEYEDECEKIRQEGEAARSNLINRGKSMIEETKIKAESDRQRMEQLVVDLEHRLKNTEAERDNIEMLLRNKINNLKDKLEDSSEHNADLIRETEDLQEKIKSLDREYMKLQEDNDRFRRQLGAGGFGGGQIQAQLERLQREYNAVLQENRNLKKNRELGTLDETEDSMSSYGRGRSTISQVRREYEERIESLNDEKRELVMKNSAAITDVQKAEQRAWEREQEVTRLKNELTSLKLELARADYKRDGLENASPHQPHEMSFMTAEQEMNYSPLPPSHGASSSTTASRLGMGSFDDLDMPQSRSRSPSLNRAMKNRAEHESVLRSRISSLTGTPPRAPSRSIGLNSSSAFGHSNLEASSSSFLQPGPSEKVLSPTKRHENVFNTTRHEQSLDPSSRRTRLSSSPDKSNSAYSSDVFGLRRSSSPSPSIRASYDKMPSLMDERSTTTYATTNASDWR